MCFIMNTCEQRHPTLQHSGLESYYSSVSGLYEAWPEPWTSRGWYVSDPSVELFPAKTIEPFSSLTPLPFLWPAYCQRIPKHPETLVEGSQPAKMKGTVWKQKYWPHKITHLVSFNTLWTGDADLRLYITTVQDGWRTSVFLTRAWFPRTINCLVPVHKGECFQRYHTLQHY